MKRKDHVPSPSGVEHDLGFALAEEAGRDPNPARLRTRKRKGLAGRDDSVRFEKQRNQVVLSFLAGKGSALFSGIGNAS
jgi:hypothetical protein